MIIIAKATVEMFGLKCVSFLKTSKKNSNVHATKQETTIWSQN